MFGNDHELDLWALVGSDEPFWRFRPMAPFGPDSAGPKVRGLGCGQEPLAPSTPIPPWPSGYRKPAESRCADEVWEGHPDSVAAHRDAACVQNTATPPTPHGSPATDPPRLSSTACRGKISAKRDNSRYQPLTSLAAEVPGQHHQKHRKSKPNHPSSQPSGHQLGR